jgi:hypothetical protein
LLERAEGFFEKYPFVKNQLTTISVMKLSIVYSFIIVIVSTFSFKCSAQGTQLLELEKTFGDIEYDEATSIIGLHTGKTLVAGYSQSDIPSLSCPSTSNFWVFQLDSNLNLEWMKCFGGSGTDEVKAIKNCTDGGSILIGKTNSKDGDVIGLHNPIFNPFYDIWVLKLDSTGNINWQKCLGGSSIDEGYDISITNDSGYILLGEVISTDGDIVGNHGDDFWICKLNSAGTKVWSKCLGGYDVEFPSSCVQSFDGSYFVAGSTFSMDSIVTDNHGPSGVSDAWVVKLDDIGNVKWKKCYGGTGTDHAIKIIPTWDGGFYMLCSTNSQDGDVVTHVGSLSIWLIRADSLGTILWQKTYGINDEIGSAIRTSDGGIAIVGTTDGIPGIIPSSHGFGDISIIKVDSLGNPEWGNSFGGTDSDWGLSIYETTKQTFVLAGETSSNDFDVTVQQGFGDAWVVKLSSGISLVKDLESLLQNLKVFQNDDLLNVDFFSKKTSSGFVRIYDSISRKIYENKILINSGFNSIEINNYFSQAGIYIMQIESDLGNLNTRFNILK